METYKLKFVDASNINDEHICCAIGNDKENRSRAEIKKDWLKKRFPIGHRFLKVDVRGKVFIEYTPAEEAWFPITAPGYNFIQCFWVSGRYKGQGLGKRLLHACEDDSKGKNGLVAVTCSKKAPFTVDNKFYIKHGFELADTAEPNFQLYVKKFKESAPKPLFKKAAKKGLIKDSEGLIFYYSDMCPFNAPFIKKMAKTGQDRGLKVEIRKITSTKEAQSLPAAWGNCTVFLNGRIISHMILLDKKFNELLDKELQ